MSKVNPNSSNPAFNPKSDRVGESTSENPLSGKVTHLSEGAATFKAAAIALPFIGFTETSNASLHMWNFSK